MPRFKDFGSKSVDENIEPISFKLWDTEFHCISQIQGKVLLDMFSDSSSEDPSKSSKVISQFFDSVLVEDSKKAFNELLVSPEKIVSVDMLAEIVAWLVEQYSDRPTERSEAS